MVSVGRWYSSCLLFDDMHSVENFIYLIWFFQINIKSGSCADLFISTCFLVYVWTSIIINQISLIRIWNICMVIWKKELNKYITLCPCMHSNQNHMLHIKWACPTFSELIRARSSTSCRIVSLDTLKHGQNSASFPNDLKVEGGKMNQMMIRIKKKKISYNDEQFQRAIDWFVRCKMVGLLCTKYHQIDCEFPLFIKLIPGQTVHIIRNVIGMNDNFPAAAKNE